MHTGASFDYPQCKCMVCAKARYEAREQLAWQQFPEEMAEAMMELAQAEATLALAHTRLNRAKAAKQDLVIRRITL